MNTQDLLDPQRWAETTFGGVLLQDMRRTRRAVTAATHMAKDASASRPSQRLLDGGGPPGWKTLWKGWLSLQTLSEGAHLALHLCKMWVKNQAFKQGLYGAKSGKFYN